MSLFIYLDGVEMVRNLLFDPKLLKVKKSVFSISTKFNTTYFNRENKDI